MGTARVVFDRWQGRYAERIRDVRSSAVRDLFAAASRSDMISFSGGMPEVSKVPAHAAADAAHGAIVHSGAQALQYGSSEGRIQLRELIVELMAENGVRIKADDAIVTAGAQQGLDLIAKTFIDPGDVIICEGPTYVGAIQAFSAYQPDIHCVPLDEHGMRMDLLEEELRTLGPQGAKFIYTIPNFHNPGGVTMTAERRRDFARDGRGVFRVWIGCEDQAAAASALGAAIAVATWLFTGGEQPDIQALVRDIARRSSTA